MILKLGMEHYVPKLYKVYINDDTELTLTYFTTMSNFAELVFVLIVGPDIRWAFTGPLVLWFRQNLENLVAWKYPVIQYCYSLSFYFSLFTANKPTVWQRQRDIVKYGDQTTVTWDGGNYDTREPADDTTITGQLWLCVHYLMKIIMTLITSLIFKVKKFILSRDQTTVTWNGGN